MFCVLVCILQCHKFLSSSFIYLKQGSLFLREFLTLDRRMHVQLRLISSQQNILKTSGKLNISIICEINVSLSKFLSSPDLNWFVVTNILAFFFVKQYSKIYFKYGDFPFLFPTFIQNRCYLTAFNDKTTQTQNYKTFWDKN